MIWVRWAIPDIPKDLKDSIRREAYITNRIIIKQEAECNSNISKGRDLSIRLVFFHFNIEFII